MSTSSGHLRIPLSAFHQIDLDETVAHLVAQPREKDFTLYTIDRKVAPDGRDLIYSELVIAGSATREAFPRARDFPVHFLKSYHPWCYHADPKIEFDNAERAAEILGIPQPIGCDANSFRTSFLPGQSLAKLSPFTNIDPPERCLDIARQQPILSLIGLWRLAEEVYAMLARLHDARFAHRDLELHNIIISTLPVHPFLIDFETSDRRFFGSEGDWLDREFRDLEELLRLAIFLQSALGRQRTPLGMKAVELLPRLFHRTESIVSRLDAADRHVPVKE